MPLRLSARSGNFYVPDYHVELRTDYYIKFVHNYDVIDHYYNYYTLSAVEWYGHELVRVVLAWI